MTNKCANVLVVTALDEVACKLFELTECDDDFHR